MSWLGWLLILAIGSAFIWMEISTKDHENGE